MRKIALLFAGILAAAPALAHDFWIQPVQFALASPGQLAMSLFVGHGADRSRWAGTGRNVVQFRSLGPGGLVDRTTSLRLGAPGMDALVPISQPGSHVFALQSTAEFSQLPFLRFNDYVVEEGITPIAEARRAQRRERDEGREFYSRRAKAIVQVGPVAAPDAARVTQRLGLSLEIVPARHPMMLGPDRVLVTRVLFNGRPLAGALVKITDLAKDAKPAATGRTRADGKVAFRLKRPGEWQMNVIWAQPLRGNPKADFRTTFSSLSFASN